MMDKILNVPYTPHMFATCCLMGSTAQPEGDGRRMPVKLERVCSLQDRKASSMEEMAATAHPTFMDLLANYSAPIAHCACCSPCRTIWTVPAFQATSISCIHVMVGPNCRCINLCAIPSTEHQYAPRKARTAVTTPRSRPGQVKGKRCAVGSLLHIRAMAFRQGGTRALLGAPLRWGPQSLLGNADGRSVGRGHRIPTAPLRRHTVHKSTSSSPSAHATWVADLHGVVLDWLYTSGAGTACHTCSSSVHMSKTHVPEPSKLPAS